MNKILHNTNMIVLLLVTALVLAACGTLQKEQVEPASAPVLEEMAVSPTPSPVIAVATPIPPTPDIEVGQNRWVPKEGEVKVPVQIESRIGIPFLTENTAYFGTEAGILYAMDLETGQEKWRLRTTAPNLNQPTVVDGVVYMGGQDGVLRALDAENGEVRWQFEAGRVDWAIRDKFINGTPTILNGVVYFSSEDFNVYAVDAQTGQEVWRFRLDEEPQALELPIVDGIAYIGSWDGYLYAIDIEIGQEVWRSQTDSDHMGITTNDADGNLIWQSNDPNGETLSQQAPYVTVVPIIVEDSVYFTDWSGNLMAVDIETGQQRWRYKPETVDMRHVGSRFYLAHHDDLLYYATVEDKHLYGVDRHTGQKVWEVETDGWLFGPIPGTDGIAMYLEIMLSESGEPAGFAIHGLALAARDVAWTNTNIGNLPFVQDGVVYFGGFDGTLHGLDLQTGEAIWKLGQ